MRFNLPVARQSTVGVSCISLVEPATPKPTVFQVQGVLNP
jgi:hypothetical protein